MNDRDIFDRCVVCGRLDGHCDDCHRGHDHTWDRLQVKNRAFTEREADKIRAWHNAGLAQAQIARVFGVAQTTISDVVRQESAYAPLRLNAPDDLPREAV